MTKSLRRTCWAGAAIAAALLLALAPPAAAHGAIEPREIDARILADEDGALGPAACADPVPQACGARPKGLDLLTLDVREARWSDPAGPITPGTRVVHFRLAVQDHLGAGDQAVEIRLAAGGEERTFGFGSDGGNYTSTTCTAFSGPIPVPGGDGDQQAFECTASYGALGVNGTGDALSNVTVQSKVGGQPFDEMPGTWFLNGQRVPFIPSPEEPTEDGSAAAGNYTLEGPARLATVALSAERVDLRAGAASVEIQVASALNRTDQVAFLNLSVPAGVQASLSASTLNLRNGTTATARLDVASATRDATLTLVVGTDLGAYVVVPVAVAAPPPPPAPTCPPAAGSAPTAGAATGTASCPPTGTPTSQASGAPEWAFVSLLLAGLAAVRRRR